MNDPAFMMACLEKPKPTLGYADPSKVFSPDQMDCRHMMMIAMIKRHLPKHLSNLRIVEIGGGFGNWTWLSENEIDYLTWTIIDMPFVSKVQDWYLSSVLQDFGKVKLIDTDHYPQWKREGHIFDLAIGAHSMSEFAFEDFHDYFKEIVLRSRYFFYATHFLSRTRQKTARSLASRMNGAVFGMINSREGDENQVIFCDQV
jgi:hypothetical protein